MPEEQNNPFAEFGGEVIKKKTNPFAEFGGELKEAVSIWLIYLALNLICH